MTDIIFSFDTEDFTSPRAAEGILNAATILREEGIRGCFCMVGLLADQLLNWGRADILEALRYHEVQFHSYGHSLHPTIHEYTDIEDFDAAYRELIRQETLGVSMVKAATGVDRVYAGVPAGANENYVAMYAYHDMGIPVYAGGLMDTPNGRPAFLCNELYMYYRYCLEDEIIEYGRAEDDSLLEELATRESVVIYHHPNRGLYRDFWDAYNYYDGINHYPFGEWKEADAKTDEEVQYLKDSFRTFIRRLKADGRFRFRTYSDFVAERCGKPRHVTAADVPAIAAQLRADFHPIETPVSMCISDIFAAAVSFLRGKAIYGCGRVYGFLDEPYAITEKVTVSADAVREAAKCVDISGFMPTSVDVGGVKLGPADFLFAMLGVLEGEEQVTLEPRPQNIDLTEFEPLATFDPRGWMFSDAFQAEHIRRRTPLQGWTIRY